MAFVDYYKVMGIPKDYPQEKMKQAYRDRAKKLHPSRHNGDPDEKKYEAMFKHLIEANNVLSDPEKRKLYDKYAPQYGENWEKMAEMEKQGYSGGFNGGSWGGSGFGNGFSGGHGFGGGFNAEDLEDIFGGIFGGRNRARGSRTQKQPTESVAELEVSLTTALLGGSAAIKVGGKELKLKIKAGTQPGSKLRLTGMGGTGVDGKPMDLILTIKVKIPTSLTEEQKKKVQDLNL